MLWLGAVLCLLTWAIGYLSLRNALTARRVIDLPLREVGSRPWPSLSVVVPARNEGSTIQAAMKRRMATDYPALDVIIVDDRSDDTTGELADALAAADERVRVVHNEELPAGWLGKVHALHLGARAARTDWILFSDADVAVAPGTLRRVLELAETGGYDAVAAMATIRPGGVLMGGLHAFILRGLYAGLMVRAIENPRSSYGVAVGAFTLVRRSALEASPGFEAIRLEVADDLMLGRLLKASGARCTVVDGAGAIEVDLYPRLCDFIRGAEKNAWAVSAGFSVIRGLLVAAAVLALDLVPLLLAVLGGPTIPGAVGALTVFWALASTMAVMRRNGRSSWGALLYPVGTFIFFFAAVRGTVLGKLRGGLSWRGTFYPTELFLEARRQRRRELRERSRAG